MEKTFNLPMGKCELLVWDGETMHEPWHTTSYEF